MSSLTFSSEMTSRSVSSFDSIPAYRFFGLKLISRSATGAEVALPLREEFVQNEGLVHGGVISALADTAGVYVFLPELPDDNSITSVEFKLNFLRPVFVEGGELCARSTLVRRGRRVAVCDVEVHQGEKIVAKGLFTYLLFDDAAARD